MKLLDELPEAKELVCLVTSPVNFHICSLFSSYNKLERIIAYCMRLKIRKAYQGSLQITELENAGKVIVKPEINGSKLLTLNPLLDKNGIQYYRVNPPTPEYIMGILLFFFFLNNFVTIFLMKF